MVIKEKKVCYLCIAIFIFILYEFCIKESMISHQVKDKKFMVYDKFQNYDKAGKMLYEIDDRIHKLFQHLDKKYLQSDKYTIDLTLKKRLRKMITNYKTHHLKENFPIEHFGGKKPDSSYTLNKRKMAICLRDDKTKKFHKMNDIMFVCIHEISHILSPKYGHPKLFWQYFKFLLHEAIEIGIYRPVDYAKKNIKYCNTELKANPYFTRFECDTGIPHTCL